MTSKNLEGKLQDEFGPTYMSRGETITYLAYFFGVPGSLTYTFHDLANDQKKLSSKLWDYACGLTADAGKLVMLYGLAGFIA